MKRRYAVVGLALVVGFSAISPALGGPSPVAVVADGAKSLAKKALGKSKKANKRSRKAKRQAKRAKLLARENAELIAQLEATPGPKGEKGDPGPQGPPGPATGPAGGDLTGNYPDPSLAPGVVGPSELASEAVTGAAVAPNSLGGAHINESTLVGVDKSSVGGSFFSSSPGGGFGFLIGGGLFLNGSCTGPTGGVGFEFEVENDSGFSRTVYAHSITDGGSAQVERVSIANGQTATVLDIPESAGERTHWVTILFTQNMYSRYEYFVRTGPSGSGCAGWEFRTLTSG